MERRIWNQAGGGLFGKENNLKGVMDTMKTEWRKEFGTNYLKIIFGYSFFSNLVTHK